MAATTAGALKAYIESLGLSLSAYRDEVPEEKSPPYVRIHEAISITPRQSGDFSDHTAQQHATEEAQLDLFQQARDLSQPTRPVTENYGLADTLVAKLHGARLPVAPKHVYGVRVLNATRFPNAPDDDDNVVRHLITVALDRAL